MVQEFTSTDDFKVAFEAEASKGSKFIVLFSGTVDADGNSWCGDCVIAKDQIKRITDQAAGKRTVLKGIVARAEWMGNAAHPYRQAPLSAGGVPTMCLFEGSNSMHSVGDLDSFANEDLMDMFLDE